MDHGITASITTISRALGQQLFAIKKVHTQPDTMNILTTLIKKKYYVGQLQAVKADNYICINFQENI